MRRFIAYVAMTTTLIVGVGALAAPTMLHMDMDLAYANGKTLYFRASEFNESSLNGNYDSFLGDSDKLDVAMDGETYIVSRMADTIRDRLDNWGISEYDVTTEGYDTIRVSLRTSFNNSQEYTRLQNYLSFSGQKYELDASNTAGDSSSGEDSNAYEHNDAWETMLDGKKAEVTLLNMNSFQVPVVIVPIDDKDKSAFDTLLDYCKKNTVAEETDSSGSVVTEGKDCNVVLWANRGDEDRYENKADPNVSSKILFEHSASDDQCVYYKDGDDDKEHPYFQMIPSSEATSSGTYDPTKAQSATDAANYLANLFNASAYKYHSDACQNAGDVTQYRLNFMYSEDTQATVDPLIRLGDWSISPAMGRTMISVLVGMVLLFALLGMFHRVLALQEMAVVMTSGLASLATFVAFGAQFNIAALIALITSSMATLFGAIFYGSRLRNELYKGRTLKKACQEASKASSWPMVDAGIISIVIGVFLYVLGGSVCRAGGVMLTLGGFFGIFANLILTKLSGWLLCNDSGMQKSFPKMLGVKKEEIPNLMQDEKQKYFGPYSKKSFQKGKFWAYGVSSLMILAGIGGCIGFGIANDGNVYNDATYHSETTTLRLEVRSSKQDAITVVPFANAGDVYTAKSTDKGDLLHQYTIDDVVLGDMVSSFSLSSTPKDVYETPEEGTDGIHYYYFYYEAKLNRVLDPNSSYTIASWNPVEQQYSNAVGDQLSSLSSALAEVGGEDASGNYVRVSFNTVTPKTLNPYIGDVCLGLGVGLAVCAVYLVARYRFSRGLALSLVAIATTFMAWSFFVYTRISVSPMVALGMIFGVVVSLCGMLFLLSREKELFKEDREKEKGTLASRSERLNRSTSYEAGNVFVYAILAEYLALVGFAIGPVAYAPVYLCAILGIAFGTIIGLVCLAPISIRFATWNSKVHLPKFSHKKKQGGQLMKKKRSGEPEEAIFIGIND